MEYLLTPEDMSKAFKACVKFFMDNPNKSGNAKFEFYANYLNNLYKEKINGK